MSGFLGQTCCDRGTGCPSIHRAFTVAHVGVRLKKATRDKVGVRPQRSRRRVEKSHRDRMWGEVVLWAKLFKIVVLFLDL